MAGYGNSTNYSTAPWSGGNDWLGQNAFRGINRGEMLMAAMGMMSGRNLQEGFQNAMNPLAMSMQRGQQEAEQQRNTSALQTALGVQDPQERARALAAAPAYQGAVAQAALAPAPDPLIINNQVVDRKTLEPTADFRTPSTSLTVEDRIRIAEAGRDSSTFHNHMGQPIRSMADIGDGQVIPKAIFGYDIPDNMVPVKRTQASNGLGFEFVPIRGSDAADKQISETTRKEGQAQGLDAQVRAYSTLFNNRAITSTRANTLANTGAKFSQTGIGKALDSVSGNDPFAPGNQENTAARETIQGLSMASLMNMISASDVSARAMDSDAEMKAWLGAIRSDNYEAALLKLYMLDKTFGDGTLLDRSLAGEAIDLDTYYAVRQMYDNNAQDVQYYEQKARQYAALGGASAVRPEGIPESFDGEPEDWEFMTDAERALYE
jgi:hypothetical protein